MAVAALGWALLASIPSASASADDLTPPIHTGEVSPRAAFLPQVDLLATFAQADEECQVIVWKFSTGEPLMAKTVDFAGDRVVLTRDGKEILLIPRDTRGNKNANKIRRWNIGSGAELPMLELPAAIPSPSIDSSPDGKYLSVLSGKELTIWQLSETRKVFGKTLAIDYHSVAFGTDSRFLLACGAHGIDRISLPKGEVDFTYTAKGLTAAWELSLTPDKKGFLATTVFGGYWRLVQWNLAATEPVKVAGEIKGDYISRRLARPTVSNDGMKVAVVGHFGNATNVGGDTLGWGIRFSFPDLEEQDRRFRHGRESVFLAGFDADPDRIVLVSKDVVTRLNLETGELIDQYALSERGQKGLPHND